MRIEQPEDYRLRLMAWAAVGYEVLNYGLALFLIPLATLGWGDDDAMGWLVVGTVVLAVGVVISTLRRKVLRFHFRDG